MLIVKSIHFDKAYQLGNYNYYPIETELKCKLSQSKLY
jgi:hypothetical protein